MEFLKILQDHRRILKYFVGDSEATVGMAGSHDYFGLFFYLYGIGFSIFELSKVKRAVLLF